MFKRIVHLVLALSFAGAVVSNAQAVQEDTTHLKFKGIPIKGIAEQFRRDLKDKSFTQIGNSRSNILKGVFAGYEVISFLFTTPESKTVYAVYSYTMTKDSWFDVYDDFFVFKEHLSVVYGPCTHVEENGKSDYCLDPRYAKYNIVSPPSDSKEIANERFYLATWDTPKGFISVMTNKAEDGKGRLLISYVDKLGSQINEREKKQLIIRDL